MPFDVVRVGTDEVRATCETGGEAGRLAGSLNTAEIESGSAARFRVIHRKTEASAEPAAWQMREYGRIGSGEYRCTPWLYETWFNGEAFYSIENSLHANVMMYGGKHGHFAHVAKGNPEMVAFTPDATWGERDAQKRMRVGRYLTQYYGDVLSNERIQELCASWDAEFGVGLAVKFADTREMFSHVYQNGPDSCMSHRTSAYNNEDIHPAEVYAAGDLAVAYLENGDRITARAICWPAKKLYGRVYGDEHRMHELMRALDYEHEDHCDGDDGFCGARLLKIPYRGGYVMPWLDHVGTVSDNGEFFVIDRGGDDAQCTSGTMQCRDQTYCNNCGERYDSEDGGGYVDEQDLCESCLEDETFYCEGCSDRHIGSAIYSDDLGHDYCRSCYDERHSECHECDAEHANDNMTGDVDGNLWCERCAEDATRNEFGEIDETYEPSDDTDEREPTPTIHDPAQGELTL